MQCVVAIDRTPAAQHISLCCALVEKDSYYFHPRISYQATTVQGDVNQPAIAGQF